MIRILLVVITGLIFAGCFTSLAILAYDYNPAAAEPYSVCAFVSSVIFMLALMLRRR
jgi:hypothetical protein